ncbi:hypothetical protein ElyMa_006587600 [Elysia marginata]|uniref:Uncharacterized protein n=1 Tax=Elysia marginata TaxID=1093978 RepID=A0AAV4IGJ0_9GAST|nr:hypothetical protein ElyMa_006587600 [Elysia marginata]
MGQHNSKQDSNPHHHQDLNKRHVEDFASGLISKEGPVDQFPVQAWPSWATSLTQRLPPDGDRGIFRGEFILVQAPSQLGGRNESTDSLSRRELLHKIKSF